MRIAPLLLVLASCSGSGIRPKDGATLDSATTDEPGPGTAAGPTTGSGSGSGGVTGTGTGASTDPGPRGLPEGLVAFFYEDACPPGWSEWFEARGRGLVAVEHPDEVGVEVGRALDDEMPLLHDHPIDITFDLEGSDVAGSTSCCNGDPGRSGQTTASGPVDSVDSGLPTVAMRLCRHVVDTAVGGLSLPPGAAAFVDAETCPEGMRLVPGAGGRFVVGLSSSGTVGTTVGQALTSGEIRTHVHTGTFSVEIPERSVVLAGGANQDHARKGTHTTTATTGEGNMGVPYLQALLCEAELDPGGLDARDEAIPAGAVLYATSEDCPDGWADEWGAQGRLVVGATLDGTIGATHGDPLADGEDRAHIHGQALSLTVPGQDIAGLNGCCFDRMGSKGTFAIAGQTDPASTGLPTFGLRVCRAVAP